MDIAALDFLSKQNSYRLVLSNERAIQALSQVSDREATKKLIDLLDHPVCAKKAYEHLSNTVGVFDNYYAIIDQAQKNNLWAKQLLYDFAEKKWLTQKPKLPQAMHATVFKVPHVTAEMLSPLKAAWTRDNIALHAAFFLKDSLPNAIDQIQQLKAKGYPIAFVTDQIDTKNARLAQRQSAIDSLLWHIGELNSLIDNKAYRGIVLSQYIDEFFYNIAENRGTLLLEINTNLLKTGDRITVCPYQKHIILSTKETLSFDTQNSEWQSIWQAESRTVFLLGNTLAHQARTFLNQNALPSANRATKKGYTLAQKLIGKACGFQGVKENDACIPVLSAVSLSSPLDHHQDNALIHSYSTNLVIKRTTAHTAFYSESVGLKPNDGKAHTWLNRLLVPDSISLSDDSDTRSALGITFATSTDKAYEGAITGSFPITMPTSLLIKCEGKKRSDIKLRDILHAMTLLSATKGLFDQKCNALQDNILEIQGLEFLEVEQAYEIVESLAAYPMISCIVQLDLHNVIKSVEKKVEWLKKIITQKRYSHHQSLQRQLAIMEKWLLAPNLLKADQQASYQKTLHLSLDAIQEPLLASIQNPAQIVPLSELAKQANKVDEVWVGSSSIHLDHYRIVAQLLKKYAKSLNTRLWLSPPSPLEVKELMQEGYYQVYGQLGVQTEMPEHAFCTQSRFKPNAYLVTTSPKAFSKSNRYKGYIASPEIATLTAILGRLPTLEEYQVMVTA